MACCYIAASMIAFIINSCEALDIDLNLQYNESVKHGQDFEYLPESERQTPVGESGIAVLSIFGMTCAACTNTVEQALSQLAGVNQVLVSLALQEARIFHSGELNVEKAISAVEAAGYEGRLGERAAPEKIEVLRHSKELASLRSSLKGLGLFSTLVFGLGQGLNFIQLDRLFSHPVMAFSRLLVLYGLTAFASLTYGDWIFQNAASAARQGRVNMHTLISVSTFVGLSVTLLSISQRNPEAAYFDTILGVIFIISVGRYMDLLSRRRASNTFVGLYSLMDETSYVQLASLEKRVPTDVLRQGDEILIPPFNIIPCDSYVVSGTSQVNEAIITGESYPKSKTTGSLLLAGSRNGSEQLRARVHQDQVGSFLSQLIKSIEGSLSSKASAQQRVDVVTRYFVSIIFVLSAIGATTSFFAARERGFYAAVDTAGRMMMTILAAACPCALGLATPCAVMAGIDIAWRKGILMLEGGETMEISRSIDHIVMDKTGTLTQGNLTVSNMSINSRWHSHEKELAVLICAAEENGMASHPLAMAVFRKLLPLCGESWNSFQSLGRLRNFEEIGGRGVKCEVNRGDEPWRLVCVGNLELFCDENVKGIESLPKELDSAGSAVFVAIDGHLAASMILQDTVRPDAKTTIDALKARSITVSMLTGDNAAEASRISHELDIPVTASCATPDMKLNHIRELQRRGKKVMMIGDGMNDGPSLAAADIGVMIAHGRKCFSSGGGVLILHSQLQTLITLLDISKTTMEQVTINITWSMAYNVIAVALAMGIGSSFNITISPPIAAAMMSMSSIFITMQGLVLRSRLAKQHEIEK